MTDRAAPLTECKCGNFNCSGGVETVAYHALMPTTTFIYDGFKQLSSPLREIKQFPFTVCLPEHSCPMEVYGRMRPSKYYKDNNSDVPLEESSYTLEIGDFVAYKYHEIHCVGRLLSFGKCASNKRARVLIQNFEDAYSSSANAFLFGDSRELIETDETRSILTEHILGIPFCWKLTVEGKVIVKVANSTEKLDFTTFDFYSFRFLDKATSGYTLIRPKSIRYQQIESVVENWKQFFVEEEHTNGTSKPALVPVRSSLHLTTSCRKNGGKMKFLLPKEKNLKGPIPTQIFPRLTFPTMSLPDFLTTCRNSLKNKWCQNWWNWLNTIHKWQKNSLIRSRCSQSVCIASTRPPSDERKFFFARQ